MSDPKFTVGMKVLLYPSQSRDPQGIEVEIVRVGRKLVYIKQYGREVGFYIDTGRERSDYSPSRILTFEEAADRDRRQQVRECLRERGFRPTGYGDFSQDTATLEAVLAVLDAAQNPPATGGVS